MESFHWNDRFLTGLPEVDAQHQELVRLINRVGDSLAAQNGVAEADLGPVLDALTDYTRFHFADEEELMARVGVDPRHRTRQQELHRAFVQQLTDTRAASLQKVPGEAQRLMKLLVRWLGNHILGTDQIMGRQVQAIRAGATPEEAYALTELRPGNHDLIAEPLVDALNDLYNEVASRNHELLALNQTLEARVIERTEALSRANDRLEAMAMTDPLTGLPNRRHAMSTIERFWEASREGAAPMACLLIDADGFKQINDQHGHDAGDEVLRQLATTLRHSARTDDVVCRLGGDEFLVLMPATALDGAMHFAELLRQAVDRLRVPAGAGFWKGSVSVGVAARTDAMPNAEALIKAADDGVYLAKRGGRNRVESGQRA